MDVDSTLELLPPQFHVDHCTFESRHWEIQTNIQPGEKREQIGTSFCHVNAIQFYFSTIGLRSIPRKQSGISEVNSQLHYKHIYTQHFIHFPIYLFTISTCQFIFFNILMRVSDNMEFSHFPICYILFSRWKDWRDKVAAELRQSVRSSKRIYIFYLQCSLTVFYVAVQQSEAADINVSK